MLRGQRIRNADDRGGGDATAAKTQLLDARAESAPFWGACWQRAAQLDLPPLAELTLELARLVESAQRKHGCQICEGQMICCRAAIDPPRPRTATAEDATCPQFQYGCHVTSTYCEDCRMVANLPCG